MDKISRAIKKFTSKEQQNIKIILLKIKSGLLNNLDIKKLKNHNNIFRVRSDKIRIIYQVDQDKNILILAIERRSDVTYNL